MLFLSAASGQAKMVITWVITLVCFNSHRFLDQSEDYGGVSEIVSSQIENLDEFPNENLTGTQEETETDAHIENPSDSEEEDKENVNSEGNLIGALA